jgi:hypothetical protein
MLSLFIVYDMIPSVDAFFVFLVMKLASERALHAYFIHSFKMVFFFVVLW